MSSSNSSAAVAVGAKLKGKNPTPPAGTVTVKPGEELSRDDVKAQREAKKAEKAAKRTAAKTKGKANVAGDGQITAAGGQAASVPESVAGVGEVNIQKQTVQVQVDKPLKTGTELKSTAVNSSPLPDVNKLQDSKDVVKKAPLSVNTKKELNQNKENLSSPKTPKSQSQVQNNILLKVKESAILGRKNAQRRVSESKVQTLFDHLPQAIDQQAVFNSFEDNYNSLIIDNKKQSDISPVFQNLCLKYATSCYYVGSNERTRALINALKEFVQEFQTPEGKQFNRALAEDLRKNINFLQTKKPFAVGMTNVFEYFIGHVFEYEGESKEGLIDILTSFQKDRIETAKNAIVLKGKEKILDGDKVLVYGSSEVVTETILAAVKDKKKFSIYAVERRYNSPTKKGQGLDFLKHIESEILDNSLNVTYVGINGLSNIIGHVTKVFLGAHALLTNGYVMAQVGTSQIALLASTCNIPVIFLCETYKFTDKSPTDAFSLNELDENSEIIEKFSKHDSRYFIAPLIKYDLTPPEFVTACITDIDILPCSSVPVVLRVQESRAINKNSV